MTFTERLLDLQQQRSSVLCVGLDPDTSRMPQHLLEGSKPHEAVYRFCADIIDATLSHTPAFKFNLAFFETFGSQGWRVLERLIEHVDGRALVIADAKRGDIGNTARMYAESLFDHLGADACTVAPYMGRDSVEPFLDFPGKLTFVLAHTSNPGHHDFQQLQAEGEPVYAHVVRKVQEWTEDTPGEAGLVVGATDIQAMKRIREMAPGLPLLIPGVGAQGGNARDVITAAGTSAPMIINSSRAIIYASSEADFAEAAADAARKFNQDLRA